MINLCNEPFCQLLKNKGSNFPCASLHLGVECAVFVYNIFAITCTAVECVLGGWALYKGCWRIDLTLFVSMLQGSVRERKLAVKECVLDNWALYKGC